MERVVAPVALDLDAEPVAEPVADAAEAREAVGELRPAARQVEPGGGVDALLAEEVPSGAAADIDAPERLRLRGRRGGQNCA